MSSQNKSLTNWEKATNELADSFVKKYFDKTTKYCWVGGKIGGLLCVDDYLFDLSDILHFTKSNYSTKKMFESLEIRNQLK